ncbi:MAG: LytTR family DNA-binding domain-containing protein [Daejeonella sp.]
MTKLNALIVDDEEYSRKSLFYLLEINCPHVHVVSIVTSVAEARKILEKDVIDVVFLDIAMPKENGFELLPDLQKKLISVIFTTAYDQYAIRAIKASAVDYLLKPVDIEELKTAVEKVIIQNRIKDQHNLDKNVYSDSLENLMENMNDKKEIRKLTVPYAQGFHIVDIKEIVYIEADSNYSIFHLLNGAQLVVAKSLGDFEDILTNGINFVRIHKSIIINLEFLKDYNNKTGYVAILHDGTELPVSRRRNPDFAEKIKNFFRKQ